VSWYGKDGDKCDDDVPNNDCPASDRRRRVGGEKQDTEKGLQKQKQKYKTRQSKRKGRGPRNIRPQLGEKGN